MCSAAWHRICSGACMEFSICVLFQPAVAVFYAIRDGRKDAMRAVHLTFDALTDPISVQACFANAGTPSKGDVRWVLLT
jgi:hypothetical protein